MVRINLLPPEVLEKRRFEKWYGIIFLVFLVLLVIVLVVYGYFWLSGAQKNSDLQLVQEQTQKLQEQADAFAIFEQKEADLAKRQTVATTALRGRINMGRLGEEVSLVLPDEVWLQQMVINETDGLLLTGYTPYSSSQSMDVSYKSVAKTMVRLNELDGVSDVWLTNAANAEFAGFIVAEGKTAESAPVVGFAVKGKVTPSAADSSGQQ